jgi:peptidoglycan/LPS O-acetylase OafA/YrhL
MNLARIRQAYSLKANLRSIWDRPTERYAPIDGLRALSMLWVVLAHLCLGLSITMPMDAYVRMMDRVPWLFSWAAHGEKALDSFFVISGFLIGMMLLTEHAKTGKIELRRFYARRYLRLMPAYAVALAIIWASHVLGPEKERYVWANILYVNNFLPRRHLFMDWSWSLAVEEQFYLCLPIFLLLFFFRSKRPVRPLVALGVLALAIRAFVLMAHPNVTRVGFWEHFVACAPHFSDEYFDALYVNLATRFSPFVVGLALAWVVVSHEPRVRGLLAARPRLGDGALCAGALLLLGLIAVPIFDPHVTLPHAVLWLYICCARSVWSVAVALVMLAVLFPTSPLTRALARLLSARAWFPVAQLSYCTYLFHIGFLTPALLITFQVLGPRVPFDQGVLALDGTRLLFAYVIALTFSFFVGALAYLTVERPFLNLRPR